MPAPPAIVQSERFRRGYASASPGLRLLIEGAVHDFVRKQRSLPKQVTRGYDRHAVHRDVLEIDLAGGPRMLARYGRGKLHLLEVGGHDIVRRYGSAEYALDKQLAASALAAPASFWPENRNPTFT